MPPKVKTLLFSTLFPSSVRPTHGIFVETRLRELLKTGEIETKVVAPVPWFPFSSEYFGTYGKLAATPRHEKRNGIDVHHPRYFLPPKVGMNVAPHTLAHGALPTIREIIREGFDFDLIDAHYFYPDGVAAAFIGKALGKPFIVTGRGTDLNLIPDYPAPRRLILEAADAAAASIGVSQALIERLAEIGAPADKLHVIRNGVDLDRFQPLNMESARQQIGIDVLPGERLLLSVGNLVELKGHHLAIQSLSRIPEAKLAIVGEGHEKSRLKALARQHGVEDRVYLAGMVAQDNLRFWYNAADVLVLCSSREGMPNVLLEAMACGTPVVATNVGGIAEIVSNDYVGTLMVTRTADALVSSLKTLFSGKPDRQHIRQHAQKFGWEQTSRAQLDLFKRISHA